MKFGNLQFEKKGVKISIKIIEGFLLVSEYNRTI